MCELTMQECNNVGGGETSDEREFIETFNKNMREFFERNFFRNEMPTSDIY